MIILEDMMFTYENSGRKDTLTAEVLTYGHDFDFGGLALPVVKSNLPLEELPKETMRPCSNCEYLVKTYLSDAAFENLVPQNTEDTSPSPGKILR